MTQLLQQSTKHFIDKKKNGMQKLSVMNTSLCTKIVMKNIGGNRFFSSASDCSQ